MEIRISVNGKDYFELGGLRKFVSQTTFNVNVRFNFNF